MYKWWVVKYVKPVALLLVATCFTFSACPRDILAEGIDTLHPGYASSPIVDDSRSIKNKLQFSVMEHIAYSQDVKDSSIPQDEDILLCREGNEIQIFYSRAIELSLSDKAISKSVMIPAIFDGDLFFVHLLSYQDGRKKTAVVDADGIDAYAATFSESMPASAKEALKVLREYEHIPPRERRFSVSPADDAVVAAISFFEKIGANNVSLDLIARAKRGEVKLLPLGEVAKGSIVAADIDDAHIRAWSIASDIIFARGGNPDDMEELFGEYYGLAENGEEMDFDLQSLDPFFSVKRLINDINGAPLGQNEGELFFKDRAYDRIWEDVALTDIADCVDTIADIKRIFRQVALHEISEYNDNIKSGKRQGHPVREDMMPGMDPSKIVIEKLSDTTVPTDIITNDGYIRINENFVKLMHVMGEWGLKKPFGNIPKYDGYQLVPEDIMGEMYESIIYSLAIHSIRGHFPINNDGVPEFTANEVFSQTQRGRRHLYVNTLAMMYYWVLLVDRNKMVAPRARMFMRRFPYMVAGLSKEEKDNLPFHLMNFVHYLSEREALPHKGRRLVRTGETRQSVTEKIRKYSQSSPGGEIAMNEGGMNFDRGAFRDLHIDVFGVEIEECADTVKLIKEIFHNVATHEIMDHNAKIADPIYRIHDGDMPGMDPSKIVIEKLSDGIIPTDITTDMTKKDGLIKINENFVKLMYILLLNPEKNKDGRALGEVAKSIIYSLAIHTVRGHFPVVKQGFVTFNRDEASAQPERGRKYLYQNLLGMMYYWIMLVERNVFPESRAEEFMEENPDVFSKLSEEERRKLPGDLKKLCDRFDEAELIKYADPGVPSKMGPEQYYQIFKDHPEGVSNEGDLTKRILMERIAGNKDRFAQIFNTIMFGPYSGTAVALAERTAGVSIAAAKDYLDAFVCAGILFKKDYKGIDRYERYRFTPKEVAAISEHFLGMGRFGVEEVGSSKGKVLELTEARQAEMLLDEIKEASKITEAKGQKDEIVIAVETGWVKGAQKSYVQDLIKTAEKLGKKASVEIVRGTRKNLASELEKVVTAKGIPLKNVVVLASAETLEDEYFRRIAAEDDLDLNKAFLAEVDTSKLTGDSYVRILEMMSIALRLAFGQRDIGYHPDIEVNFKNKRTVVFIPRAEPFDLEVLKEIYRNQRRILEAA